MRGGSYVSILVFVIFEYGQEFNVTSWVSA